MRDTFLVTPSQMRDLDEKAIREYGIPGIVLMENAAAGICEQIFRVAGSTYGYDRIVNVLFVCGKGNNGGDGFAAARRLLQASGKYFDSQASHAAYPLQKSQESRELQAAQAVLLPRR